MFERIHEKWKEERESKNLTSMDDGFYSEMREFLKKQTVKAKGEITPTIKNILDKKLERINYVINDLIRIRATKIVRLIMAKQEIPEKIPREENEFYQRLNLVLDLLHKQIFSPKDIAYTDVGKALGFEIEEEEEIEYVHVRFLKSTDNQTVQGIDGKTYGPFEPGDHGRIPKENAALFVKKEIAQNIEVEK